MIDVLVVAAQVVVGQEVLLDGRIRPALGQQREAVRLGKSIERVDDSHV
jgi:hypothetical protein